MTEDGLSLSELNRATSDIQVEHGERLIQLAPPMKERPECLYCRNPFRPIYKTSSRSLPKEHKWIPQDDPKIKTQDSTHYRKYPGGWNEAWDYENAPPVPSDDNEKQYILFQRQRQSITKRVWTGKYHSYGKGFCCITHAAKWAVWYTEDKGLPARGQEAH